MGGPHTSLTSRGAHGLYSLHYKPTPSPLIRKGQSMDRSALLRHAVSLLANRPHSPLELTSKLARVSSRQHARALALDPTAAAAAAQPASIVAELAEHGAVSDDAYAQWHTAQRSASRPRSRMQLLAELAGKRVGSDAARAAVAQGHNELSACAAQALRRQGYSPAKLRTFLVNKAFSRWAIERVLEARGSGQDLAQFLQ